jgi:hypothetical protein
LSATQKSVVAPQCNTPMPKKEPKRVRLINFWARIRWRKEPKGRHLTPRDDAGPYIGVKTFFLPLRVKRNFSRVVCSHVGWKRGELWPLSPNLIPLGGLILFNR